MSIQWIGFRATAALIVVGAGLGYVFTQAVDHDISKEVSCYPGNDASKVMDFACSEMLLPKTGGLSSIFNDDLTIKSNVTTGKTTSTDFTSQLIEVLTGQSVS